MKNLATGAIFASLIFVTGCIPSKKYSELLDANKFADQVIGMKMDELETFNAKTSFLYLGMADLATHANHITNASLIGIAASVAKGHLGGNAGALESQRLLYGLVLSEGARYAAPNEIARALRIAGQQSACLAKTISQEDDANNEGKETVVLAVMQRTRSNLHERMTKHQPVNITSLVTNFKGNSAVLREDNIQLDNALAQAKAKSGSLEEKLLSCLKLAS